jgi:hypothetical protein
MTDPAHLLRRLSGHRFLARAAILIEGRGVILAR